MALIGCFPSFCSERVFLLEGMDSLNLGLFLMDPFCYNVGCRDKRIPILSETGAFAVASVFSLWHFVLFMHDQTKRTVKLHRNYTNSTFHSVLF